MKPQDTVDDLVKQLRERFINIEINIDKPDEEFNTWFIDVVIDNQNFVIEFRPRVGFGISNKHENPGYGEGVDEIFFHTREVALKLEVLSAKEKIIRNFIPKAWGEHARQLPLSWNVQHACEHHQYHHEKNFWLESVIDEGRKMWERRLQFYTSRFERLREWVKDLPEKKIKEYFGIVANGSLMFEPPTYAQQLTIANYKLEQLNKIIAKLRIFGSGDYKIKISYGNEKWVVDIDWDGDGVRGISNDFLDALNRALFRVENYPKIKDDEISAK